MTFDIEFINFAYVCILVSFVIVAMILQSFWVRAESIINTLFEFAFTSTVVSLVGFALVQVVSLPEIMHTLVN